MIVTPEILAAYADGELSEADNAKVEEALSADPALLGELGKLSALSSRLADAYDPVLAEPVPERLTAAAQTPKIVDLSAVRRARGSSLPAWAAMAACLVVGLMIGLVGPRLGGQPLIKGDMSAGRQLASALDSGLAGETQDAVRLGVSFRDQGGVYCRTFDAPSRKVAGLACRDPGGWAVRAAATSGAVQTSAYQTASSIPPAVAGAMEAIMAGEPLDASQEKTAKSKGWRPHAEPCRRLHRLCTASG